MSAIGSKLAVAGLHEQALELFRRAKEKTDQIDNPAKKSSALANLGSDMAEAGFLSEAFALAHASNSGYAQSVSYATLAVASGD